MPVIPPLRMGTPIPGSIANKAARAPRHLVPRRLFLSSRAVQIAPGGDRIYLLDNSPGHGNPLHVWGVEQSIAVGARRRHAT